MITCDQELRQPADDHINWNESYYFSFFDVETNIAGFFRMGLQKNRNASNLWCHLMKDGETLYHRFQMNLPYTDAGLEDIEVGSLRFQMLEALRLFSITFNDRSLSVDLKWQGFHDICDPNEGMEGMTETVGKGHYEQHGVITGVVRIDGQDIRVNGTGFRDHSWGIRDWEAVKHWKACTGQFGQNFAFSAASLLTANGSQVGMGMIYDGQDSYPLANVSFEVDDLLKPQQGQLVLHRSEDNPTTIDIEFLSHCEMPHDFNLIHESWVKYRMGGRLGCGAVEINRRYSGFS